MQNNYLFKVMTMFMIFLFFGNLAFGQSISISTFNSPITQDFNTLSNTAASTTNTLIINGWFLTETGGGARDNEQYGVDTGSSSTGDTYSYGSAANSDRSLGSLRSGTLISVFGATFKNNTGATINSLEITYTGEQWRLGTINRVDRLDFQYSTNATDLTTGTWTDTDALDFTTPNSLTVGQKDGNATGNRTTLTTTISGLSISNGSTFWIRWNDADASGADDGLAIDDFSLTAKPILSINDISITEGNSGTSNATFAATLSAASATDVTFTYTTSNGTANEPDDYAFTTGTGTISAGNTSTTIIVPINGDINSEPDENFTINLTGISASATAGDVSGLCTITNDDAAPIVLTINDISITEGNSGSFSAIFNVSLSAPAPAGGVSFAINTANGSATSGSDYSPIVAGVGIITEGLSSVTISVDVLGDVSFEPNETFFVNISDITAGIIGSDVQGQGTITNDDFIKIHEIQGSGLTAAITGPQTVRGIVTRAFFGTGSLNGFYLQEEDADADADPNTSEGIFVFNPPTTVAQGDLVVVTGTVIDFSTTASGNTSILTEFSPTTSVNVLSSNNPLPSLVNVTLPVTNLTDLEKYEGMLINLTAATGNLVVTDNFNLGRYGQLVLAADDPTTNAPGTDARIDQYTQFNPPSVPGNTAYLAAIEKRLIYVDDANGFQNIDPILFGRGGNPLSASNTLRTGDAVANVIAVLDHRFEGYRLQTNMSADLNVLPANPRPATPNLAGSPTLIVGNMNMLNFFNGDGLGGGFPTPRGANTLLEFTRQKDKTIQAIINSGADIMSLNEMENDGFGAQSAIQELVNGLNAVAGAGTWAFVSPPVGTVLSTDQITVGMIYKPAKALPLGELKALTTGEFVEVGRGALAQTFKQTSDGAKFTLVGNHFKSKGSLNAGVGNPDIGDGQANNNGQRKRQAQQLAAWLATNPTGTTDPDYLIVGDLNAYAKEDPLTTLESAGYATLIPNTNTSYQFDGAHGALDHALGNASLAAQKVDAKKWNINADEPTAIDYNIQLDNGTIIKTAGQITSLYNSDQYRNSDHDPVIVGLKLICDKPIANLVSDPISGEACQGSTITLTGSGGTLFSFNGATYSSTATFSVSSLGTTTIKLKVKNAEGCESDEVEKVVNISSKPDEVVTIKTICSGETFTWAVNSQTYSSSTTVTVVNDGCTANQKLELTVTPKPDEVLTKKTICSGETFNWAVNSQTYSSSTTVTVVNDGCTANQKLELTVTPKPDEVLTIKTICSGETFTWSVNSQTYSSSTTVTVVNDGCTANQKLELTVTPKPDEVLTIKTICSGETFTWSVNSQSYSSSTTITVVNDGCTANQKLELTVTPKPDEVLTIKTICSGETFAWSVNSQSYSSSTTITVVNDGCTADQKLELTVTPKPDEVLTIKTICSGETFTWSVNSQSYSSSTTITVVNDGCTADQKLELTVTPKPAEVVTTKTICSGETFTWSVNSQTYSSSTTVTVVNDGCTANQKLELTVAPKAYAMTTNNQNKTLAAVTDFTTKECEHIARVEVSDISGDAAGFFNATVWVETDPLAGPFVQRHYQISPNGTDGQSGKAIVTLYFTQNEFNTYNAATSSISTTDDLPTSPTDIDGISRLRIMKYPGTSEDGLGLPASYTGTVENINPIDTDIIFEEGVWKIKFPVSSFSGFFVNGQTVALPVRLIDFKGSKTAENQNTLIWNTVDQVNFEGFEIQKSSDSKTFESVGKVTATSFSKNKYQFIDHLAIEPINYYRLKMNDLDGKYEYSKVISVKNDKVLSIIGEFYPNPSQTFSNLKIVTSKSDRYIITAHDLMGRIIQTESLELQKGENLIKYQSNNLPKGLSFIRIEANGISAYRKLLKD
jgi:predicted extracellular nuclease